MAEYLEIPVAGKHGVVGLTELIKVAKNVSGMGTMWLCHRCLMEEVRWEM